MTPDRWRRVEELFDAARQRPAGERAALLRAADPELRAEVESLLAANDSAGPLERSPFPSAAEAVAFKVGDRLGHFEITGLLGRGGMGEVYRARDTRLGREVAVKTLPPSVAADRDRVARFEREARAASALNHPNIVSVYDVGHEGGVSFIVSELVEGETLRGPLPLRKLVDVGTQICDGLAAAHAAGVVHRDLKPGNVMLTRDGRVKILDFGLARTERKVGAENTTLEVSHPGLVLGTPGYMSPEQVRGEATDARSDIFSLGVLLYEMASGKKAFPGDSSIEVMNAILKEEPPELPPASPPELDRIIRHCLEKEPGRRFQSAADVGFALGAAASPSSGSRAGAATAKAAPAKPLKYAPVALALALLAAGWWLAPPSFPDQSKYLFTPLAFPQGICVGGGVWSPDGKAVAYATCEGERCLILVRYLDQAVPVEVMKTDDRTSAIGWTADSHRVLCFRSGEEHRGIWSVAVTGGEPERVLAIPGWSFAPVVTRDYSAIAVLRPGDDGRWGIWISAPPGSPLKQYLPDPFATRETYNGVGLAFSPDGKQILLFMAGDHAEERAWLMPYPADPANPPKRILEKLPHVGPPPFPSWMPDSRRIVFSHAGVHGDREQLWMADTVSQQFYALTSGTGYYVAPSVSPDGKRLVFTEYQGDFDIVSVDLATAKGRLLLATGRNEQMPAWAAHKDLLAYVTDRNGPMEIWVRSGGVDRPLATAADFPPGSTRWLWAPVPSPDGQRVVYLRTDSKGGNKLCLSAVAGGAPVPLTQGADELFEFTGSWSPDGNWFAFKAIKAGKSQLMKVKTGGQAAPVLVTNLGDGVPFWSPDGDWILWGNELVSPDGKSTRSLPQQKSGAYLSFSADGKRVYGLRLDGERVPLFFVETATGKETVVGDVTREYDPAASLGPSLRLSLAPDGRSVAYASYLSKGKSDLWLLEGFDTKPDFFSRLRLRR